MCVARTTRGPAYNRFKRKESSRPGQAVAKRAGHREATIALARTLAVIMHAICVDGTFYCGDPAASKADVSARCADKQRKLLKVIA